MANSIQTTGQLREFMVNMLLGVKNGDLDEGKARNITKMVAQINESFYSEIKIAKVMLEGGQQISQLGELPINKKKPDDKPKA